MNCPALVDLAYEKFSVGLHSKVSQERIPINGSVEVTMRCNMRCEHCYLPLSQRAGSAGDELSFSELQRIISELADEGCLWLLFTGGEPFLRRDFLDIYDYAKHRGMILTVFTNGTLLTEEYADHLAEWRPFLIEISLYGATEATYEKVTGIPGSYARCMRGIELLRERNLPLSLKSVLLSLNQHELDQMRVISENLGMDFRFDPVISAGIDGSLYPTQFRLTPELIIDFERKDPRRAAQWPKSYAENRNIKIETNSMYTCSAGRSSFHIDSHGRLSVCLSSREPYFDLRQGNFKQGWEYLGSDVLTMEYSQYFSCANCELRAICAQCPAAGFSEFGDPEARVPFICELAHLRQQVFDLPDAIPVKW